MFGKLGATPVLGLPGNPVSSFVGALLFLRPALLKMQGLPTELATAEARLGCDLKANDHRADFLRARLARDESGALVATPFPVQDSSMMSLLARADCLVARAPHAPALRAGEFVPTLPLAGGLLSI
jgi:molybdopterin molybdotransferase